MAQKPKPEVNIPSYIDDPHYRYKMPVLQLKVEGRGKMIKTIIENLEDIALALGEKGVNPEYVLKFFGLIFGVKAQSKNNKYIVSGNRDPEELKKALDQFIEKYVLCKECKNPETNISISKRGVFLHCAACGGDTYINTNDDLTSKIEKDLRNFQKSISSGANAPSPRAQQQKESSDPVILLGNLLSQDSNEDQIIENARALQKRLGISDNNFLPLVIDSIFGSEKEFDKSERLSLFVKSRKQQLAILPQIENLCSKNQPIIKKLEKILEELFESELIDEDIFYNWYDKPPRSGIDSKLSQRVRTACDPFIAWLEQNG